MRPAFLAVYHATQANVYDDATALYFMRIRQGRHDRLKQLGRYREELELLGYFFVRKWDRVAPQLTREYQVEILQVAGNRLGDVGRSEESDQAHRSAKRLHFEATDEDE